MEKWEVLLSRIGEDGQRQTNRRFLSIHRNGETEGEQSDAEAWPTGREGGGARADLPIQRSEGKGKNLSTRKETGNLGP